MEIWEFQTGVEQHNDVVFEVDLRLVFGQTESQSIELQRNHEGCWFGRRESLVWYLYLSSLWLSRISWNWNLLIVKKSDETFLKIVFSVFFDSYLDRFSLSKFHDFIRSSLNGLVRKPKRPELNCLLTSRINVVGISSAELQLMVVFSWKDESLAGLFAFICVEIVEMGAVKTLLEEHTLFTTHRFGTREASQRVSIIPLRTFRAERTVQDTLTCWASRAGHPINASSAARVTFLSYSYLLKQVFSKS